MSDSPSNDVRYPSGLIYPLEDIAPEFRPEGQFVLRQREFVHHVFAYSAYLRQRNRNLPVADAFVVAVANLLDSVCVNAPAEACHCAERLHRMLSAVWPVADASPTRDTADGPAAN